MIVSLIIFAAAAALLLPPVRRRLARPETESLYKKAVIILLAGIMVWGSFTTIESFAGGTAQVEDGVLTLYFEDANIADSVEPGMDIIVGDDVMTVRSVGQTAYGVPFAVADTTLADGTYSARVAYDEVQLIHGS